MRSDPRKHIAEPHGGIDFHVFAGSYKLRSTAAVLPPAVAAKVQLLRPTAMPRRERSAGFK
jgi:hypothetical protein